VAQKGDEKLGSLLVGVSTLIAVFFISFGPAPAQAQFSPGKEGASVGGGDTTLEISQVSPGKAVLHTANIYAVFLDGMLIPGGAQPHLTEADHSGKGTSRVVSATNPALANLFFCWRWTGADWSKQACAPIVNGTSDVTIDVGAVRSQVFAMVPVLVESPNARQVVAWGSHPENTRRMFTCPGMKDPDMLSVFVVDKEGRIRVALDEEAARYQKHYVNFCQR
jgi:hypothetical protein